jgi:uncharacterized protein (DUF3084 family)
LAKLSASLQQTQDGLSAKTQEAESLRLQLSEKEDTINELEAKLVVANNQCAFQNNAISENCPSSEATQSTCA